MDSRSGNRPRARGGTPARRAAGMARRPAHPEPAGGSTRGPFPWPVRRGLARDDPWGEQRPSL